MKLLFRLLSFLSAFRWQAAFAILLGCAMIASNIALLGMAAYLIAAAALAPLLVTLTIPIYIVRFASVSRAGSRYLERLVSHDVTFRLLAELRTWVYSRLEPLAPAYLQAYRSGDVLTRLVSDVEELQNIYLRVFSPIMVAIAIGLLTFGLFSLFSPVLAWTALAFLAVTGFGVPLLAGWLARGLGEQQLALRAELNAHIVDGIQGVQDLLACGRASDQESKIAHLQSALGRIQGRMAFIAGLQQAMNDLLMNLALWTLLILSIPLVISKAIDGVYLGFLGLVILASFEAVQPLGQAFQFLGHSLAAGERLFKIAGAIPVVRDEITSGSRLAVLTTDNGHLPNNGVTGAAVSTPGPGLVYQEQLSAPEKLFGPILEFEHVHFKYAPGENEALEDISFCAAPGKRIAIVGPSGAGKSTIVNLVLRFWDPTAGVIRLDGQDIRQHALADLRKVVGVVAQDTYLFNDTIRGNLLLARPGATESDIEQALEQAQLADFVRQLPRGLGTWVGEQGLRLSGGERQRLAIARTLLKNPPLLILDEVTANLDPLTEHDLLATLDALMQGRTTLIITHRLIDMERMDEILVLDEGQVRERGTHEQLLKAEGLYHYMLDVLHPAYR
ncbi:MAG TPA: thiol reductant ABC exporter subunit CydC [Ktedonobacteraceae bacterium]|nr:thiol reductant ABC exporter subunit CydC [Ktedonobacteraceae bacterium]